MKKRIVVVSGPGAGIGEQTVKRFLDNGDTVIGVDIIERDKINKEFIDNKNFSYQKTNVTVEKEISALFDLIDKEYGRVDILCNIAGGYLGKSDIEEASQDDWNKVIDLNLTSVFLMSKYAVPIMKKNKFGRIISMSSVAGRMPTGKSCVAYAASKAGVIGFTKYMAMELGPFGITVNAVSPSTTMTDRARKNKSEEDLAKLKAKVPVGRIAEPRDPVNVIFFLASDESDFINGTTLDVTGGFYMT